MLSIILITYCFLKILYCPQFSCVWIYLDALKWCYCSLGFIGAWMVGTLGVWVTLFIRIILIVIVCHWSWCYWPGMRHRSLRLNKPIETIKWSDTADATEYFEIHWILPVQSLLGSVSIGESHHLVLLIFERRPQQKKVALDAI